MSVIAFDTSQRGRAVIARTSEAGEIEDSSVADGQTALVNLQISVATMLNDNVKTVVAVIGPGSYTGVRIGLAAALGVAQARSLPLYGISSFVVAAMASAASPFHAVVDAGRGRVYLAGGTRSGVGVKLEPGRHLALAEIEPDRAILSVQEFEFDGAVRGDALRCLAAAVPEALRGEPLRLNEIRALHIANQDV